MPDKDQINTALGWVAKAFPALTLLGIAYWSNYLYRVKDEFKDEMMQQIVDRFVTMPDLTAVKSASEKRMAAFESEIAAFSKKESLEVFKTKTNSEIQNIHSRLNVYEATVGGTLIRLEEKLGDLKEDIADIKSSL